MNTHDTRPALESLACVEPSCELYGQPGEGNLTVRKVYSKERIRSLRCRCCRREFSERKGAQRAPPLWNTKVSETQAVSVAAHLSEGCSQESIARLVASDISVVQRLNQVIGNHVVSFTKHASRMWLSRRWRRMSGMASVQRSSNQRGKRKSWIHRAN